MNEPFDFLIAGSGFAGSILAMCLVQSGYRVYLIEKKSHPRFAIGESSTPIADMILRDLAKKYDLEFLNELSRYGDWQRYHPDVICGLKRGFSYYQHSKGEPFKGRRDHQFDLLVAASLDDENSDTNWLRSDVDHFLVKKAIETGVNYDDQTEIEGLFRLSEKRRWRVKLKSDDKKVIEADWIIDATGSSGFSNKFFGTTVTADPFYTNSEAIYTHMDGVLHWMEALEKAGHKTDDYPYNPDHSALHHLIDEGWIWMLRFNNDRLSCGLMLEGEKRGQFSNHRPEDIWNEVIQSYPSIQQIFDTGMIALEPGQFIRTERLQRLLSANHGDGWVALNYTVGFVDPMHSTGIAHSLKGVEDILAIFDGKIKTIDEVQDDLSRIYEITVKEISLIDKLVSMTYLCKGDFELFHAVVMVYFVATVQYEQSRLNGRKPDAFLCAADERIEELVTEIYRDLYLVKSNGKQTDKKNFIRSLKKRIKPLNRVGLMDESKNNMYRHTAVTL